MATINNLPRHLFDHIFSFIDETSTRDVTKWCLSTCNKELYMTLPVCLNTYFRYADVMSAQLTEDCACMLLDLNRITHQLYAWTEKAAQQGWVRFLQAMYDKGGRLRIATQSIFVLHKLIQTKRMDIITVLHPDGCIHDLLFWESAFVTSIQYGYTEMVMWLHGFYPHLNNVLFIEDAAAHGCLEIVKYMHECRLYSTHSWPINFAAMNGHYDVLVYLHEHSIGEATHSAMDKAAAHGFLEIVRFLHENRKEGCTTDAMDHAAMHGHFDVVKFLNENRTEGYTILALEDAETHGHPDITAYLRQHGKHFRYAYE